jgi:hypothetical protein
MIQDKKVSLTCAGCKKKIHAGRAHTVIDGRYHCADCTYKHDYPDRGDLGGVARRRRLPLQAETLFEPPRPIPPSTRRV